MFEGLGISLVEAAASALPAVGARAGGIVDVIEDGASGWLVPPGDPVSLAARLRDLVLDAGARARMGHRAREVALARFDERAMLVRYRTVFAEACRRGAELQLAAR